MLSVDYTFIFQSIGYLVLLLGLSRFLFKPIMKVLDERDEKTGATMRKASESDAAVGEKTEEYDRKLREAALKGHEERSRLRLEALDREKAVIEAARAEAASELERMKKEVEKGKLGALSRLSVEAISLSREIAGKVLERKVLMVFVGLSLLPALALASAEGGEHSGGNSKELLWKAINVAIFMGAAYFLWIKVLRGMVVAKGENVRKALEEARSAMDAAEKKAVEYREKAAGLERRLAEMEAEIKADAEVEKKRILAEAEKAAAKIKAQARGAAEQELKKAMAEIQVEVALLAVRMAEDILRKELRPEDQARLVKGYLEKVRLN
jgi:F-type H+-transporting ATPase subunit b